MLELPGSNEAFIFNCVVYKGGNSIVFDFMTISDTCAVKFHNIRLFLFEESSNQMMVIEVAEHIRLQDFRHL